MIAWYSGLSTGEAVALWVLVYFALATPGAMLLGHLLRRRRKAQTRPVNDRKD